MVNSVRVDYWSAVLAIIASNGIIKFPHFLLCLSLLKGKQFKTSEQTPILAPLFLKQLCSSNLRRGLLDEIITYFVFKCAEFQYDV